MRIITEAKIQSECATFLYICVMENVIYIIKNHINNKVYIGSAQKLNRRINAHLCLLRKNKHHSRKLQNFVNKHGIDSLYFEVIEKVDNADMLINREQFYLDTINPFFNITKIAESRLGCKHTDEAKIKMVEERLKKSGYKKGWKHSDETRAKISKGRKGIKISDEAIKRGVETRRRNGYVLSKETIEKIRLASTGRKHSEEAKKKISESHKGERNGMYGRKKELHPRYGTKISEETREKMRNRGKKIIDTETNTIYKNIQDFMQKTGIPRGTTGRYLAGLVKSVKRYKYYEKD